MLNAYRLMDEETREKGEGEVHYATVVFNSNISASKDIRRQKEAGTVYDQVKVPNGALEQMTPVGGNDQKKMYKWVALCLGILCVILISLLIAYSSYILIENRQLVSQLQESKEKQSALLAYQDHLEAVVGNLSSSNENLLMSDSYPVYLVKTCEIGWVNGISSCFAIVDDVNEGEGKTWAEAQDDCRGRNADLVVIDNEEEQDLVHNNTCGSASDYKGYWLGLSNTAGNGTWSWVDGTNVTLRFWTGTNDTTSSSGCAITWQNGKPFGWSAVNCTAKKQWICEKPFFYF